MEPRFDVRCIEIAFCGGGVSAGGGGVVSFGLFGAA